jgi:hypothetical protein
MTICDNAVIQLLNSNPEDLQKTYDDVMKSFGYEKVHCEPVPEKTIDTVYYKEGKLYKDSKCKIPF